MAVSVLAFAPHHRTNRALAAFFAVIGLEQLGSALDAVPFLPESARLVFFLVSVPAAIFVPVSYLIVLSALDTPLVARLARDGVRTALLATGIVLSALIAAVLLVGVALGLRNNVNVSFVDVSVTVYFLVLTVSLVATAGFALAATASAFRRAPRGSLQRARARWWFIAFGAQDALLASAAVLSLIGSATDPSGNAGNGFEVASSFLFPAVILVSAPLLAYGIAKTQLFDIDLRVKWGAARGAVTAILVAVFFVVEKLVETYASRVLGVTFGAISAGLMLFFVPRLNRAADRVADKAAPQVKPTSEYLAYKKVEVYRAAVESALEEGAGSIDERSHRILTRLRTKLRLSDADASAVEAEVVGAPTATG